MRIQERVFDAMDGVMSFNETVDKYRQKFSERGELLLYPKESINDVVKKSGVSSGYGVYVISGCHDCDAVREIFYIGKAGTIQQDGHFKDQGIRKRLTMKQDGLYRKEFFQKVISEHNLSSLHVEWFVTYNDDSKILPFFAEAELLAAFFSTLGRLPTLNIAV